METRRRLFTFYINKELYKDKVKEGCDAYYDTYEAKPIDDGTNRLLITGVTSNEHPLDYMALIVQSYGQPPQDTPTIMDNKAKAEAKR